MAVHPEIAARLPLLEGIASFEVAFADPGQRARLDEFFTGGDGSAPGVATRGATAPGPHGPVPVRVYEPADGGADRPCLVWLHGGAFRFGDLDMAEADWTAREVCDRAGAVVVSVDYRLAVGGVHFPVPHDDVVAAVRWVRDTAAELGVDAGRISLGGASAGGNLAAGAALRLRDADGWQPAGLVLAYPATHPVPPAPSRGLADRLAELPPVLVPTAGHAGHSENYLGGPLSSATGYAFPGLAVLDGLCPVLVLGAEYDDLRASGEAFAAAAARAGVDVTSVTVPGVLHGFLDGRGLEPVVEALDLVARTVTGARTAAPTGGIHPAIAAKLPLLEGIADFGSAMADPAQRAVLDEFMSITGAPEPPQVATRDEVAAGPHGAVPVRVYLPGTDATGRPALVWMHGGAFVGGDLEMPEADWTARQVCERAGAVVVSVDYRLCSGDVHHPVPSDDVVAAYRWVHANAVALGVDPARIAIGGASAGGNLAIGAALRLRDEDLLPAALLPVYPVAHAVIPPASASLAAGMAAVPDLLRFFPPQTRWFNENLLGGPLSTADGYAFGALAQLDGLCPTVVVNAEFDDLRPSGEDFAARCALAGVDVRQVTARGMLHGFLNTRPDIEPVGQVLDLLAEVVAGSRVRVAA